MLQTTLSNPIRIKAGRKALLTLLGVFTGGCAYDCWWNINECRRVARRAELAAQKIENDDAEVIDNENALHYPWYRDGTLADWEYRPVKLRGYFKDERFFIKRERDGQEGYLVLAPFVTAVKRPVIFPAGNSPREHSVLVSLGWVPKDQKSSIEMGGEPLPLLPTESTEDTKAVIVNNRITGLVNDPEYYRPDDLLSLTEFVGVVQRDEGTTILRPNWPNQGLFNSIDLDYLVRFFRIFNGDSARSAYIERVVKESELEGNEETYPQPATGRTFQRLSLIHI
eukprot:TRINITY_DN11507_c0_g1_i9.p1 TRINITY_DN11507_c0_g1~~TRINITY_DN11507_c0_g1_i9.p1  ORF type:complete len:282 (-),score=66.52 TRINITY_DN11507_c0_g1_i9:62-907(-)